MKLLPSIKKLIHLLLYMYIREILKFWPRLRDREHLINWTYAEKGHMLPTESDTFPGWIYKKKWDISLYFTSCKKNEGSETAI